ncbi:MAG: 50S ribosomal protein L10 [Actinomycetota bacterium]
MAKQAKVDRVADLKERIEGAQALLVTSFQGLSVGDTSKLRRSLADVATFGVVKNTLMRRAADASGLGDEMAALLTGPTAVAFVTGDVVAAAKRIADAAKEHPDVIVLKGAYLDGRVLEAADAKALASLDSREVMLSKIAGMLQSEMARAASMFQALQSQFLGLLESYKEKVPAGDAPAVTAAAEPVAEPAASSDAAGEEASAAVEEAAPEAPAAEAPAEAAAEDGPVGAGEE